MKRKILQLIFILSLSISGSYLAKAQVNESCIGIWYFECPYAPEGFNKGTIDIRQDTVFTTFASMAYKFPSSWVRENDDSLFYNVNINGDEVLYILKNSDNKMLSGEAVTSYGKSPLILTRKQNTELASSRR